MEDLFTNRAPTEKQGEMLDEITRQMLNVSDCLHLLPQLRPVDGAARGVGRDHQVFPRHAHAEWVELQIGRRRIAPLQWMPHRAAGLPQRAVHHPRPVFVDNGRWCFAVAEDYRSPERVYTGHHSARAAARRLCRRPWCQVDRWR